MTKIFSVLVLMGLCASAPASAKDFYSLKVKAILYFSSMESGKKRVGAVSGKIQAADDGSFATLTLGGKKYPFILKQLERQHDSGGCSSFSRRPEVTFTLESETLKQIMAASNHAWYRRKSTHRHVSQLIGQFMATHGRETIHASFGKFRGCSGYSATHDYSKQVLDFSDKSTPESLRLVVKIGHRLSVR